MTGSIFEQTVNAYGLQVDQHLFMRGVAFNGELTLHGTQVGGQLDMSGSTFEQKVNGGSLLVSQNLFMRGAAFGESVELRFARIGGDIDLRGTMLTGLDLSGATVTGDLRLSGQGLTAAWRKDDAFINLRNVQIRALQDSTEAWPPSIDLEGFTYGSIGGFGETVASDPLNRTGKYWKSWLARGRRYRPQPYAQLANVLSNSGRSGLAAMIQYAGREQERAQAWTERDLRRWLGLTVNGYLRGYGIGAYNFRLLYWVCYLVVLGAMILWFSTPATQDKGFFWCLAASLDRLLPIIQLNKEFADFFNGDVPGAVEIGRSALPALSL
jgi:hypothetical protein